MTTAVKESQKFYPKLIFDLKANFSAKFEEHLKTWTYHLFFILHESYVNLYLRALIQLESSVIQSEGAIEITDLLSSVEPRELLLPYNCLSSVR